MPGPRCITDWPPRRLLATTHRHSRSHTDAARRPSRSLTAPTQRVRGSPRDGGLGSLARARRVLLPFGGRAIDLSSRSGGTERFLGRHRRRWPSAVSNVTVGRPRRAVWHRLGCNRSWSRRRDEMPTEEPSRCGPAIDWWSARVGRSCPEGRQNDRSSRLRDFALIQVGGP